MNPKRAEINFQLNAETKRKAEKLAESLGISLNDLFVLAVTYYLAGWRADGNGHEPTFQRLADANLHSLNAESRKEPKP
jgi:hypothetical protein